MTAGNPASPNRPSRLWPPFRVIVGLILTLGGCGDDLSDDDDSAASPDCNVDATWPVDFEAVCAGTWPTDECAGDNCYDSQTETNYGEQYLLQYQRVTGLSDEDLACHTRFRRVSTYHAQYSSGTDIVLQVDVDWVRLIDISYVSVEGGTPSAEDVAAGLEGWDSFPMVDLEAELMDPEQVQAFVDECAAEHGVEFPLNDWCDPWFPSYSDPGDDDLGIRFDFHADLPDEPGWKVKAQVDVTGNELPRCRTYQIAG